MGGSLLVARAFVLCGTGALIFALVPLRKLVLRLPPGIVRLSWRMLMALILFWIGSSVVYGIVFLAPIRKEVDLVFPGFFFSISVYVWLSSLLIRHTGIDAGRVTRLEQENETEPLAFKKITSACPAGISTPMKCRMGATLKIFTFENPHPPAPSPKSGFGDFGEGVPSSRKESPI